MTHEKALQCLLSVVHNDPGHTHLPVTPDLTPHIQVATTKDKVLLQHFFLSLLFSSSTTPSLHLPQPLPFLCRLYQLLCLSPLGHTLQKRHSLP